VREERDSHGGDGEQGRVERDYARYSQSGRKRRAWDAANAGNVAIRSELEAALREALAEPLARGAALLDVGCGRGWWLRRLRDAGAHPTTLHGVDILPERVAAAAEALSGADLRVADARALPYGDASFGAVTLLTTLSSLRDRDSVARALSEARRVTAPGGVIAVYEPRVPNPFNRSTLRLGLDDLERGLGAGVEERTITLLPPLARALGSRTPTLYGRLARLRALRTHRLAWVRLDGTSGSASP